MHPDRHPGASKRSIGRRIVRAGLVVSAAHLLFKLAGLIQAKAMTQFMSAGAYDAVYAVAFEACIFSFFLVGEEVIGPAFLPVFMRELDDRGETAAWHFANTVLTAHILILTLCVGIIVCFPGAIIRLCTAWDAGHQHDQYVLAVQSLRVMAPALICLSLGSTTYMLLNGYKRFFLAALGDAAWKFCVFGCVLAGMGLLGLDHRAVIGGLVLGSAAKLGVHLVGLRRELHRLRPSLALRNPAIRHMALLMLPLIVGIVVAKGRDIFNNVTVLSHIETQGLMQANSLGRKLYQPIGWLVPYALSIAMFPFFCELVDRKDHKQLGEIVTRSGRMLLSVFIPIAMVCAVLAKPITTLLFAGGEFGARNVEWTSVAMACYTLALPAVAIEYLLMQAFFANRRMVSVTVIGILFSFFSMGVSYIGVVRYELGGVAALATIAAGFSVSRTLKSAVLLGLLRRFTPCFPLASGASFLLRVFIVGGLAGGLALAVRCGLATTSLLPATRVGTLIELALEGGTATLGFLIGVSVFRIAEPREMYMWVRQRVHERSQNKPPS